MPDFLSVAECLGVLGEGGEVKKYPARYATGGLYNAVANPNATRIKLDETHFCVLPIGVGNIPEDVRAGFMEEIQSQKAKPGRKPSRAPEGKPE